MIWRITEETEMTPELIHDLIKFCLQHGKVTVYEDDGETVFEVVPTENGTPKPKKPKKPMPDRACPHCGKMFKHQGFGPHVAACARKAEPVGT